MKNTKLGHRESQRSHVTYFLNVRTRSISQEWSKLEISSFSSI